MDVMIKWEHCYICSDKGIYREVNEDSFVFNDGTISIDADRSEETAELREGWNILCVLDGMGGTKEGKTAASLAAAVFTGIKERIDRNMEKDDLDHIIRGAFLMANNSIVSRTGYSGTTATMLITDGRQSKLYHLGDSRAYLIRQGSILQLTKDQTVEEMKKNMGFSDSVIEADKHRLTEYLGADESMHSISPVESEWMQISEGDRMVLCTDGLYEGCTLREILDIVDNTEQERVALSLVDLALSRNVRDNVTCLYIF